MKFNYILATIAAMSLMSSFAFAGDPFAKGMVKNLGSKSIMGADFVTCPKTGTSKDSVSGTFSHATMTDPVKNAMTNISCIYSTASPVGQFIVVYDYDATVKKCVATPADKNVVCHMRATGKLTCPATLALTGANGPANGFVYSTFNTPSASNDTSKNNNQSGFGLLCFYPFGGGSAGGYLAKECTSVLKGGLAGTSTLTNGNKSASCIEK